jgi:hypothetical protein
MKKNFNSLTNHVNEMLQDRKELQEYERKLEEYNARLQRTRNQPHLPSPNQYGTSSCGCQICERTYTNTKETNAKIKPPLEFEAAVIARKAIDLLVKKHDDYGPDNISDAPGGALNGLSVRLHDKVARLNNLLSNHKKPKNETIEDTFIDILNYALIALLVLDGKWDTTK